MYCYLNGEIIPEKDANLGLNDLALLRGFGIFDYFVFERFQARFLEDYLSRFFNSAHYLGLTSPISRDELRNAIHRLIAANETATGGIRLVLTGGYTHDGFTPTTGNIFILQSAFPSPPPEQFIDGARVATHQHQRELPIVKSLNYLSGIHLLPWLQEQNADYLLYHDGTYIRESDRSNFFIITNDGTIVTPKDKILEGITRAKLIAIAHEQGLKVEEREVKISELATAQEAFLSSSTKGALPVTIIDGQAVGNGKVGPICQQLQTGFLALVADLQVS